MIMPAGKPHVSIPPYLVITFEATVLWGCFATLVGMLVMARLPDKETQEELLDPRLSDDVFSLVLNRLSGPRAWQAWKILSETGAIEITGMEEWKDQAVDPDDPACRRALVRAERIVKTFVQTGPWPWSPTREVHAVRGVDLVVFPGEVVALVGQSGSGKTTVSRVVLGLDEPTSGGVWLDGIRWDHQPEWERREFRVRFQYIPQDAMSALDPQQTALEHVVETLISLGELPRKEAQERAEAILEQLGLGSRAHALPREMSGGEQRRVTLARVLALNPKIVVADEPTSGLDPERRASVLEALIGNLPDEAGCILVTHDMTEARQWCDRILVMLEGKIIEELDGRTGVPVHPYAKKLFDPWSDEEGA
jgi:ABC-type glutathione transport system ATPase component